jgi:hypothetical protein
LKRQTKQHGWQRSSKIWNRTKYCKLKLIFAEDKDLEEIIYREGSVKRILLYVFSFVAIFVFTTIFMASEKDLEIFYWVLNIAAFLVCLLVIILEEDKMISCDKFRCTIKKKRFWELSPKSFSFRWDEISETVFFADGETREFYVVINGSKEQLITGRAYLNELDYLINTVNAATPHLPYVWEKPDDWLTSKIEISRYRKVAR